MSLRKVALLLFVILPASCTNVEELPPNRVGASSTVHRLNDCPELPCQGPLEPGAYRWEFSKPTIDFEIQTSGWTWYYSGGFRIVAEDSGAVEGLYVPEGLYFLHDPSIASRDCEESVEPGVGRSVDDIAGWLEAAPGLVVSDPTPVEVGGLDGIQLDIELARTWKKGCFFSKPLPAVPLIYSDAELGGYHWAIVPDQTMRWYILDSDDGVMIVDLENGPNGLSRHELLDTGGEIVDSLEFSFSS